MDKVDSEILLEEVAQHYLNSEQFNGITVGSLASKLGLQLSEITEALVPLINEGKLSVLFGDVHPNPYIRALPDESQENQIKKLITSGADYACVYPLPNYLRGVVDKAQYEGRPFTLELALGTPQLAYKSFDLSVLEVYRNDPRYYYSNDDIQGSISVSDEYFEFEEMPESDQVLLQTFGFSYDEDLNRAVAVFVRYLAYLSPEHQQTWRSKVLSGNYRLHPDYYLPSILGEFPENVPIFSAFLEELRVINDMCKAMERPPLFRKDFSDGEKPREFGFLVRPTLKEYNDFVLTLDKMLSDNINKDFFLNEVPYEFDEPREDGKVVVKQKGTLVILSEWLSKFFTTSDSESLNDMMKVFKDVRKKRQKPAHAIKENVFDQKYFHDQRSLMLEAYGAVRTLRLIFENHPRVGEYEISPYVKEGKIVTY